jgi:hypothetical protein
MQLGNRTLHMNIRSLEQTRTKQATIVSCRSLFQVSLVMKLLAACCTFYKVNKARFTEAMLT